MSLTSLNLLDNVKIPPLRYPISNDVNLAKLISTTLPLHPFVIYFHLSVAAIFLSPSPIFSLCRHFSLSLLSRLSLPSLFPFSLLHSLSILSSFLFLFFLTISLVHFCFLLSLSSIAFSNPVDFHWFILLGVSDMGLNDEVRSRRLVVFVEGCGSRFVGLCGRCFVLLCLFRWLLLFSFLFPFGTNQCLLRVHLLVLEVAMYVCWWLCGMAVFVSASGVNIGWQAVWARGSDGLK